MFVKCSTGNRIFTLRKMDVPTSSSNDGCAIMCPVWSHEGLGGHDAVQRHVWSVLPEIDSHCDNQRNIPKKQLFPVNGNALPVLRRPSTYTIHDVHALHIYLRCMHM